MALVQTFNFSFINPQTDQPVTSGASPHSLLFQGLNLLVDVSIASAYRQTANPLPLKTLQVFAHVDTGASITFIGTEVASELGLLPIGMGQSTTANGPAQSPNYCIDLSFVGPAARLHGFPDLVVGSCPLPYMHTAHAGNTTDPRNFGVLIGRDILAKWMFVWNGPTSTVFIAD